jgi:hypothetical protein
LLIFNILSFIRFKVSFFVFAGRSKVGRTQSEASIPRRPPSGVGSLFSTDDEAGEMFSSVFLNDLKEGRCTNVADTRISELARRNSMVPAHLKSSYPAETQFHSQVCFDYLKLICLMITNEAQGH